MIIFIWTVSVKSVSKGTEKWIYDQVLIVIKSILQAKLNYFDKSSAITTQATERSLFYPYYFGKWSEKCFNWSKTLFQKQYNFWKWPTIGKLRAWRKAKKIRKMGWKKGERMSFLLVCMHQKFKLLLAWERYSLFPLLTAPCHPHLRSVPWLAAPDNALAASGILNSTLPNTTYSKSSE